MRSSTIKALELEDRLIQFGVKISEIAENLPTTKFGIHIASQILRSGTAPASNYGEAQSAESRKDFIHKMRICLKELRETQVWLKFIVMKRYADGMEMQELLNESQELVAIFVKSIETASKNLASGEKSTRRKL